jgi:hypothetical protein
MNLKHLFGFLGLLVVITPLLVFASLFIQNLQKSEPVCGNGILEEGESSQNCCEDTGCSGIQTCIEHSCTEIVCGECEYIENKICNSYECCSDSACATDEICVDNECAEIICTCGYIEDRECVQYECCHGYECQLGLCENNKCVIEEVVQEFSSGDGEDGSSTGSDSSSRSGFDNTNNDQDDQQSCIPTAEVCDGLDNNCNKLVDDGILCECTPGQTKNCGYNNVGSCQSGSQTCQSNHQWGICSGGTAPVGEICDGNDNDCDGEVDESNPCSAGKECVNANCKSFDTSYKVQPVIFFPTDYEQDQSMVSYLEDKFEELRQFYLDEYGATFTMLDIEVVLGDNNHEWYWCKEQQEGCIGDNFEANIIRELKNKGLPVEEDWNLYPDDRITWVAAFGGGGYAGGRYYPTGGGFAMLGDAGIYAAKDNNCDRVLDYYYDPQEPNNIKETCQNSWISSGDQYGFGIGALGHELGHALNIPHPDGYPGTTQADWEETLIGYHWNYPDTGLLDQDKERLDQSPFMNALS